MNIAEILLTESQTGINQLLNGNQPIAKWELTNF